MPPNGCSTGSSVKHIILVIWQASLGGIEKSLADYFKQMSGPFRFTLYALKGYNRTIDIYGQYPVEIRTGNKNTAVLYLKFLWYALMNRSTPFHIFNAGPVILLLLRITGVKKVMYHIRGTVYWRTQRQKKVQLFFWKAAIHPGVIFIANSEHSRQRFLDQVNSRVNIQVIYNPFDAANLSNIRREPTESLTIAYAGRLARGKNLELWIDIAARLYREDPGVRFRIIGEGPLRTELEDRVRELGLEAVIRFDGYIHDKAEIYSSCDILLFLSDHESFGNVVVESILAGTPVIASDIPSMKEIFSSFPYFLVGLDDAIFSNVAEKIKNMEQLRTLAADAKKEFTVRFGMERHFEAIKKIYLS